MPLGVIRYFFYIERLSHLSRFAMRRSALENFIAEIERIKKCIYINDKTKQDTRIDENGINMKALECKLCALAFGDSH